MTVPLHAHKVTARNDGRHIVPLTIVEQKFKFRIELHPCAFESGGDELCTVPNALNKFIRFIKMKIWNFGVNALQLHLFCPHNTHSGDLVLRFAEFFHTFRMRDSTHSCLPPDAGSRRIV